MLVKILAVVGISQGTVAYLILVERKIAAWAQDRLGTEPGRPVRPDPAAGRRGQDAPQGGRDARLRLEAGLYPGAGDRDHRGHDRLRRRPVRAGRPFGWPSLNGFGYHLSPVGHHIDFQIAPGVDIGILYILAIGSLGGLRRDPGGLGLEQQVLLPRRAAIERPAHQLRDPARPVDPGDGPHHRVTLDLNRIIEWQDRHVWGVVAQPLGFLLFLISGFAETNRLPFDLPESEQELVGGFHTEYSAMKFGMFFLGEYLHVITVSFLTVILFFGGWDLPFVTTVLPIGYLDGWGADPTPC